MKQLKVLALLLCAVLLCSCKATYQIQDELPGLPAQEHEEPIPAEPIYGFKEEVRAKEFRHEDGGELYASYEYRFLMMYVENEEALSGEALETAQRNVEKFNELMQQELDEAVAYGEQTGEDLYGGYMALSDEVALSAVRQGQILTVVKQGFYYGGGAHPYTYTSTHTFDLTLGQFIDPAQIGDDPEAFRVQAGQMLIEYAESLGEDYTEGFWEDYAEIISRWNDAAVIFGEEGMKVVFSIYELGPYAMGPVELRLTYEELSEAIGEGGLEHLGIDLTT